MDASHVPEVGQVRATQGEEEEAQARFRLGLKEQAEEHEGGGIQPKYKFWGEQEDWWRGGSAEDFATEHVERANSRELGLRAQLWDARPDWETKLPQQPAQDTQA